jgi:hypothetical protein
MASARPFDKLRQALSAIAELHRSFLSATYKAKAGAVVKSDNWYYPLAWFIPPKL